MLAVACPDLANIDRRIFRRGLISLFALKGQWLEIPAYFDLRDPACLEPTVYVEQSSAAPPLTTTALFESLAHPHVVHTELLEWLVHQLHVFVVLSGGNPYPLHISSGCSSRLDNCFYPVSSKQQATTTQNLPATARSPWRPRCA
jgi:hypothetical protein